MKKLAKVFMPLLALALMFGLTACGSISIIGLAIPTMAEINIGDTTTLDVTYTADKENVTDDALLEAANKLTLAWESSDESVATVDADGKVTAIKGGEATITVTNGNGLSAAAKITVRVPLMAFEGESMMSLYINGNVEDIIPSKPLVVGPVPADADDYDPVYTSADESIATVDETGKVTAVSNGRTTITVRSGDISTEVEVTVYTVPSAFYAQDMELTVGTSGNLEVEIEGENVNFGTDFTYTSSDEEIATVDKDGVVTAVSEGEAQITVQNETGAASAAIVRVMPKPAPAAPGSTGGSNGTDNAGGSAGAPGSAGTTGAAGGAAAPAPTPAPDYSVRCTFCSGPHDISNCPYTTAPDGTCPGCGGNHSAADCPIDGLRYITPETYDKVTEDFGQYC